MKTTDSVGTPQGRPMTPQAALKLLRELECHLSAAHAHAQEVMTLIQANDDAPAPLRLPEDACWQALDALRRVQVRADEALALIDDLAPALGVTVDEVFFLESVEAGHRGGPG
jgi:hypothetical protein